jgi:hypothetical protein
MYYSGGIFTNATACGTTLDHAILAVGYGVNITSGAEYWLV